MKRLPVALVLAAALLASFAARAAPLDKASCERLKAEQEELEKAGARASMAKGPEWARINLAPDKMDNIRRLIEVDGQVLFRCNGRPLVDLPKDVEADPAAVPAAAKADAKPDAKPAADAPPKAAEKKAPAAKAPDRKAAVAKEAVKEPVKAAPKPAAKDAPAKAAAPKQAKAPGEAEAKPRPKPKPKAKANDAYTPPSAEPGANPFASQPGAAGKN